MNEPGKTDEKLLILLRCMAAAGVLVHLINALLRSFPLKAGQWPHLLLWIVLMAASALVIILAARPSLRLVTLNWDLLVPAGLCVAARDLLWWAATAPGLSALVRPTFHFNILSVNYAISVGMLLGFVINAVWIGWIVHLLLQILDGYEVDLLRPFRDFGRWVWRVAIARLIGSLGIYAFVTLGVWLMGLTIPLGVLGAVLLACVLLPAMLLFNILFAFIVPAALRGKRGLAGALGAGMVAGLRRWRRIALPVFLFSVLVGSLPMLSFASVGGEHRANLKFSLYWLVDFPSTTAWEQWVERATGVPAVPWVSALLLLLILSVSIVLVLEIFTRLYSRGGAEEEARQAAAAGD